jgi:hypothetical protein
MNSPPKSLSEDKIATFAIRAGMKPAEVIDLLDTIARWRALGLEVSIAPSAAEASHEVLP